METANCRLALSATADATPERPALGTDERVPQVVGLAERYGRANGASFLLARDVDAALDRRKGLRVNSAGLQGALMRDMGFSPEAAAAFCVLYFIVPVLAQTVFGGERPAEMRP